MFLVSPAYPALAGGFWANWVSCVPNPTPPHLKWTSLKWSQQARRGLVAELQTGGQLRKNCQLQTPREKFSTRKELPMTTLKRKRCTLHLLQELTTPATQSMRIGDHSWTLTFLSKPNSQPLTFLYNVLFLCWTSLWLFFFLIARLSQIAITRLFLNKFTLACKITFIFKVNSYKQEKLWSLFLRPNIDKALCKSMSLQRFCILTQSILRDQNQEAFNFKTKHLEGLSQQSSG